MNVQPGTKVMRYLSSERIPMGPMTVTAVDDDLIYVGGPFGWTFDRTYGFEVDPELGWGRQKDGKIYTGSVIELIDPEEE